jgi:hypothetical protein
MQCELLDGTWVFFTINVYVMVAHAITLCIHNLAIFPPTTTNISSNATCTPPMTTTAFDYSVVEQQSMV